MHQHKTKASLKYLMVIMKVKLNDWYILDRWCPSMSLRSLLLCFAFPSLPGTICITVLHGHCISTFVFMKMQWFIIRFGTFFFFKCKNQSNKESWIALCYISSTFEQVGWLFLILSHSLGWSPGIKRTHGLDNAQAHCPLSDQWYIGHVAGKKEYTCCGVKAGQSWHASLEYHQTMLNSWRIEKIIYSSCVCTSRHLRHHIISCFFLVCKCLFTLLRLKPLKINISILTLSDWVIASHSLV